MEASYSRESPSRAYDSGVIVAQSKVPGYGQKALVYDEAIVPIDSDPAGGRFMSTRSSG